MEKASQNQWILGAMWSVGQQMVVCWSANKVQIFISPMDKNIFGWLAPRKNWSLLEKQIWQSYKDLWFLHTVTHEEESNVKSFWDSLV